MSSNEWGRVDEAGTVWVRTTMGEREVGSYPGATADEALAYFARKYDELVAQVALLEQRLNTTDLAAKDAMAAVERLRQAVNEAHAVGDLDGLAARVEAMVPHIEARREVQEALRAQQREEARARKEAIVTEAEQLATSTSWKAAGDRLRQLLDEWKAAPRLDRRSDDELWKRFSAARNAFDRGRRTHFAGLDAQREEAKVRKAQIVEEAEELADSTDWGATAARYRDLMSRWKAAGRAGKTEEERLWQRFRAAQDRFFDARGAAFSSRDSAQRDNLAAKEALAAEAEALLPVTDVKAARATLRAIHERWEAVGHVPREARAGVEGRLRKVEDAVRATEADRWRRSNPEARARAEATVSQLRTSIEGLQDDLARARAAGDARREGQVQAALEARRAWLAEAEKALAEFSG